MKMSSGTENILIQWKHTRNDGDSVNLLIMSLLAFGVSSEVQSISSINDQKPHLEMISCKKKILNE